MSEQVKAMSIYLDARLHLAIEHVAKCNKFSGNTELDTINKFIVKRLEFFCDTMEKSPDAIIVFIKRVYAFNVFNEEHQKQLKKSLIRKNKPYPIKFPISLLDRYAIVYANIIERIGFKISKVTLLNFICLDYIINFRKEIKENWIAFMDQKYFSPYEEKKTLDDCPDMFLPISKDEETLDLLPQKEETASEKQKRKNDLLNELAELMKE